MDLYLFRNGESGHHLPSKYSLQSTSIMSQFLSKREPSHAMYVAAFMVCVGLTIHALYLTSHNTSLPNTSHSSSHVLQPSGVKNSTLNLPTLFIYRRTKKSGSSAMLDALIRSLEPHGYVPLYTTASAMKAVVRAESFNPFPRRLLVGEHNEVTRQDYPSGRAIIADTVRDGYEQVTSFCRYLRKVKTCDEEMVKCFNSKAAKKQIRYRWAGRDEEDDDTYIDLPLSTAHPALSTTILRRVFPNVTLDIHNWNSANAKCPEVPMLREAYSRMYYKLDQQVETLRKRMLMLAGYPSEDDSMSRNITDNGYAISLEDMMITAEAEERKKYNIEDNMKNRRGFSKIHKSLISTIMLWSRDENNSITLRPWKS